MENTNGTPQAPIEQKLESIVAWCDRIDFQIREIRSTVNAALADIAHNNIPQPIVPPPYIAPTQQENITEEIIEKEVIKEEVAAPVIQPPAYTKSTTQESSTAEDDERKFGVKWMAVIGILIAVIGVSLFIKYLIEHDMLGPVAIVSLGYITALAMVGGSLYTSESRKVLKDTLMIGGTTLGWMITWLAYGHYDMFPSAVTVAITLAISTGLMAFAYTHDNKVMFNFALVGFIFSPLVSGYSVKQHEIFWMSFTLAYNLALLFLYKTKQWASAYSIAFFITIIMEIFICDYGRSVSQNVHVMYYTAIAAAIYAGSVILYNHLKEKIDNLALYIIFVVIDLAITTYCEFHRDHNTTSIAYLLYTAALGMTAYMLHRIRHDEK
ncbi:MAG: DUF2339 domain-containing protein, partial [Bacteroidales bacterium]|nr:DUF2339 domain-containing protein [Bacteroidales bacterium]